MRTAAGLAALAVALLFGPAALGAAPSNDDFASAQVITGNYTSGSNADATKESGEPAHAGHPGGASVWFKWHATADGLVSFRTSAFFDTLLAVYSGTALDDLVEVASNDDSFFDAPGSLVGFSAAAGTDYWIAVDGKNGATNTILIERRDEQRPQNDAFASAYPLTGESGTSPSFTTFLATKEAGEPDHAGVEGGASLWYSWTAPRDGVALFDTCSAIFDTVLAAYTGDSLLGLTEVASDDDDGGCAPKSAIAFRATKDTQYRIAVDSPDREPGYPRLQWDMRPSNDDFVDAQALSGASGSVSASTGLATHELPEPFHAGELGTGSVWYRWTAPGNLRATFDTCQYGDDTVLAVYIGSNLEALTPVGSNDDACGLGSTVGFDAAAGVTYSIAVDGFDGPVSVVLRWSTGPLVPRNFTPPTISGEAVTNGVLVGSPGTWSHATNFNYGWESCPATGPARGAPCTSIHNVDRIPGQLTVPTSALGRRIRLWVTALGPYGNATASSVLTEPITPGRPRNTASPDVSGYTIVGETLEADEGGWDLGGATRVSVTFLWQRCNANVQNCQNIQGAGAGPKYLLRAADRGATIQVVVTMTSSGGSMSAVGVASGIVTPPERTAQQRRCVVPRLVGKGLKAARKLLSRGRCKLGSVKKVRSARKAGVIVGQSPKPGTRLRSGAKVSVRISLGRRR